VIVRMAHATLALQVLRALTVTVAARQVIVLAGRGRFGYHGAGLSRRRKLARFPIWAALAAAGFSGAALADSIDINLNDDSIQATYAAYWGAADFSVGFVSNSDKDDWVASVGLLARGTNQSRAARSEVGLGGKVYVVSVGNRDLRALGLGGAGRVFPGGSPIAIGGYAFYAPDVVTGGDGENFWETGVHVDFEVVKNTADFYIGYRKLRAKLDDGSHVTVDSGGHVGVRISF
jgi:hypothetical protein